MLSLILGSPLALEDLSSWRSVLRKGMVGDNMQ